MVTFPTVHLNGTSRDALLSMNLAALQAMRAAVDMLADARPNARDFYVQGPNAYGDAQREHEARMHRLADNIRELMAIVEHLAEVA